MPTKSERAAAALDRSGLGRLARRLPCWNGILVLNHHRIGSGAGSPYDRRLWSATADELDRQLALLTKHFDVIGPAELEQARASGRGRYVLLTFDDGYRDNFELALPALRRHGVPATFFLTTGFLDRPQLPWWDEVAWMVRASPVHELRLDRFVTPPITMDEPERELAVQRLLAPAKLLPPADLEAYLDAIAEATRSGRAGEEHGRDLWLTWKMARELVANGMAVGGHTVSHPSLAALPRALQEAEIEGCRERLAVELGIEMTWFSYPYGLRSSFDAVTREALRRHGVRLAFSFYGGHIRFDAFDAYDLRRTSASGAGPTFRAAVTLPQLFARW